VRGGRQRKTIGEKEDELCNIIARELDTEKRERTARNKSGKFNNEIFNTALIL
jgi:hypothetical protein